MSCFADGTFLDEEEDRPDGPIKVKTLDDVPKEGAQLIEGFEWVTMDLNDEKQVRSLLPATPLPTPPRSPLTHPRQPRP